MSRFLFDGPSRGLSLTLVILGVAVAGLASGPGCTEGEDDGTGGNTATSSTSTTMVNTNTTTTGAMGGGGAAPKECGERNSVSDFSHDWYPSVGLYNDVCSPQQVDELFAACFSPGASQEKCKEFSDANPNCIGCSLSVPDGNPQAPIVLYQESGMVDGNYGHCLSAFEGDSSNKSCGAKVDKAYKCAIYACLEQCGEITTQARLNKFLTCLDDATAGGCKTFAADADTCEADLVGKGNPVDACKQGDGEDFYKYAKRLVTMHCGADPGAGGAGGAGGGGGGGQ